MKPGSYSLDSSLIKFVDTHLNDVRSLFWYISQYCTQKSSFQSEFNIQIYLQTRVNCINVTALKVAFSWIKLIKVKVLYVKVVTYHFKKFQEKIEDGNSCKQDGQHISWPSHSNLMAISRQTHDTHWILINISLSLGPACFASSSGFEIRLLTENWLDLTKINWDYFKKFWDGCHANSIHMVVFCVIKVMVGHPHQCQCQHDNVLGHFLLQ